MDGIGASAPSGLFEKGFKWFANQREEDFGIHGSKTLVRKIFLAPAGRGNVGFSMILPWSKSIDATFVLPSSEFHFF